MPARLAPTSPCKPPSHGFHTFHTVHTHGTNRIAADMPKEDLSTATDTAGGRGQQSASPGPWCFHPVLPSSKRQESARHAPCALRQNAAGASVAFPAEVQHMLHLQENAERNVRLQFGMCFQLGVYFSMLHMTRQVPTAMACNVRRATCVPCPPFHCDAWQRENRNSRAGAAGCAGTGCRRMRKALQQESAPRLTLPKRRKEGN